MHKITMYENVLEMVEHEISELQKNGLKTKEDACALHDLLSCVKNATTHIDYLKMKKAIEEDVENNADKMSMDGPVHHRMMPNGVSNRSFYYRSNDASNEYNSYGYSRDESKRKMVNKLTTLMDDTMSDKEREAIQDCINKVERG